MSSRRVPAERASVLGGRLAALIIGTAVCVRASADPDLWGHLRFGLDLLDSKQLTTVDPYSFTQDVPWVNHEWLSELLFAFAYRAGGIAGLVLLKCAILGIAFALMMVLARSADAEYRGWLLAVAFINFGPIAFTFRPQLWTILGLTALLCMLAGHLRLWWMPLLFAVWSNMHGGWVVGVGVAGLWTLGRVLDTRSVRAQWGAAVAILASVAATVLNPYGWRLWSFLLATVRTSRPDITEWRPYWERFEVGHAVLLPLALGVLVTTVIARRRHLTWARFLPCLWLGVNGLFVSRLAPFFSLLVFFCAVEAWSESAEESELVRALPTADRSRLVIDAMVLAAVSLPLVISEGRCFEIPTEWGPDLLAASAFEPADVHGRLVLPFDWGEYAIWHWGPRLRVSIDGRRETIYSETTLNEQRAFAQGQPDGLAFASRVRPEYVWLKGGADTPTATWLARNGYVIDVRTPDSVIGRRLDLAPLQIGTPLPRCDP